MSVLRRCLTSANREADPVCLFATRGIFCHPVSHISALGRSPVALPYERVGPAV